MHESIENEYARCQGQHARCKLIGAGQYKIVDDRQSLELYVTKLVAHMRSSPNLGANRIDGTQIENPQRQKSHTEHLTLHA